MQLPDHIFSQEEFDNLDHHIINDMVLLNGKNYRDTNDFILYVEKIYKDYPNVIQLYFSLEYNEKNHLRWKVSGKYAESEKIQKIITSTKFSVPLTTNAIEDFLTDDFKKITSREDRFFIYEKIIQKNDTPFLTTLLLDIQKANIQSIVFYDHIINDYKPVIYVSNSEGLNLLNQGLYKYSEVMDKYGNLDFENLLLKVEKLLIDYPLVTIIEQNDMQDISNRILILYAGSENLFYPAQFLNVTLEKNKRYEIRRDTWLKDAEFFIDNVAGRHAENLKESLSLIIVDNEKKTLSANIESQSKGNLNKTRI